MNKDRFSSALATLCALGFFSSATFGQTTTRSGGINDATPNAPDPAAAENEKSNSATTPPSNKAASEEAVRKAAARVWQWMGWPSAQPRDPQPGSRAFPGSEMMGAEDDDWASAALMTIVIPDLAKSDVATPLPSDPVRSAAFSPPLATPASVAPAAAAGALTFHEFSTSDPRSAGTGSTVVSPSTRALEDYGNSYGAPISGGRVFDAPGFVGGIAPVGAHDAPNLTATVGGGGEEPDITCCAEDGGNGGGANGPTPTPTPPVPEPSTWAAGALALVAVGYTQRRRLRALTALSRGAPRS